MLDDKEMRAVYLEELCRMAGDDDRIVLVEADMSKAGGTFAFKEKFPDRSFNVGIAEANMIGVAAGLANMGKIVFTTTFTPFATRRALDQITISVAYTGFNIKMAGTDPGICAETNGGTHMSFEDVAVLRSIPGMVIFEPVDSQQLKKALPQVLNRNGPVYVRLFRKLAEKIYENDDAFELGKAVTLREGTDATIFASGIMVKESLNAADILRANGVSVRVSNMHTIKPIDKEAVLRAANETGAIVTAENHSIIGGLGSAVSEILVENCCVPMKRIGVADHFGEVGKIPFLKSKYKMTSQDIVDAVMNVVGRKG